jgi:uncharacterized membrane protein SpoIIM required for sporulation
MYLNSLAQRVFHNIYRGKRFPVERLRRFWTDELPRLLWEERKALYLSFAIFVLAFLIGVVSSMIDPDFARVILPDSYVDMTLENIRNGDPMKVYKESQPFGMTLGIAFNNLFVALRTALLGVLAGLGTVFSLLFNGIMVGAFQYMFIANGVFGESFLTIWIHGTLEIATIIVAGAAGLVAGSGLLLPGTYRRTQAFQISMRRSLQIFFGIAPMIILAAIFEGFLTRYTGTPALIRGAFIGVSLFFVIWYFVWLPWHKFRHSDSTATTGARELLPDNTELIHFGTVKSAGEILNDAFAVLVRYPKGMLRGMLVAVGLVALITYWYGHLDMSEAFPFSRSEFLLTIMDGAGALFRNDPVPWLFYGQVLIMCGLATTTMYTLYRQVPPEQHWEILPGRILTSAAGMILPVMGFILLFRLDPGFWGWFLAMFLYPLFGLWCAVLFFETSNPILAFTRSLQIMPWGQAVVLGILTVNLALLLYMFLDSMVWSMVVQLFSWMVPSGTGSLQTFNTLANIISGSAVAYFNFVIQMLCGSLLYFAGREMTDATSLREGIELIGTARQIRGLARE